MADVNAVIEGVLAGGVDEVHVVDAHGSGNPEPDLPSGALDSRARQVFRDRPFQPDTDLVEPGLYDAIAVVGMHAKTGSGGFASHTITTGMDVILNGHSVTETEIIGYSWGRVGVPVIFASGDDRLRDDLRTMPWLQYVEVKHATSASTVDLRPIEQTRAELRDAARRAVDNLPRMRAMQLRSPAQAAVRAVPPADLSPLENVPGIDYDNGRVDFVAPDFGAAFEGVMGLIGVARYGHMALLSEFIAEHPNGDALGASFLDRLVNRWLDYESGRSRPPASPPPTSGRKYHGAM